MKIALHDAGGEEYLQFMRQLGVEYVVSAVGPGKSGALEVDELKRKKEYFAAHGLVWDVIENLSAPTRGWEFFPAGTTPSARRCAPRCRKICGNTGRSRQEE